MEINHVDRDDEQKVWAHKRPISSSEDIYSGVFEGDMIEWKIKNLDENLNISWFAEDQDGIRINGPSGTGVNYWQISSGANSNDPSLKEWLTWNPGKWKIICKFEGQEVVVSEYNLGWRTRRIVVIGQIVQTNTHDSDAPSGSAKLAWATAVADDFSYGLDYGGSSSTIRDIAHSAVFTNLLAGFSAAPGKATEAWMGYWSTGLPLTVNPPLPPASVGPFTSSLATTHRGALGSVTAKQRYWMIQHLLNVNNDITSLTTDGKYPNEINSSSFSTVISEKQYRILHQFQTKFFLKDSGTIDSGTIVSLVPHMADNGPTKLNLKFLKGEFGATPVFTIPVPLLDPIIIPSIPLPPVDIGTGILPEPSEASSQNRKLSNALDGKALSSYASARIGLKGQRGSYRLFGKDAPWIFSEIIFEISNKREVEMKVRTSVNAEWTENNILGEHDKGGVIGRATAAPASTPNLCIFNNINIYDRRPPDPENAPFANYVLSRRALLKMEGHVECFVESASGAFPEPETTPSIK